MATTVTGDLELASQQFEKGQFREVIVALRPILIDIRAHRNEKNGRAMSNQTKAGLFMLYGRVHSLMDDTGEALDAFESASEYIDESKLRLELALERAYLYFLRDKNESSLKDLQSAVAAVKSQSTDASLIVRAHSYLGHACMVRGLLFECGRELRTACSAARLLPAAQVYASQLPLSYLSLLHLNEKRMALAAAMARDALNTVTPQASARLAADEPLVTSAHHVLPLIVLTRALTAQGLPSRAIVAARAAYDQALDAFGDEHSLFRQALAARARALVNTFDYVPAAQDYEQLLQLIELRQKHQKMDSQVEQLLSYILRTELALCLARSGESVKAEKYLEQNLKLMTSSGLDSVDLANMDNLDEVEKDILRRSASSCYLEQQLIEELSGTYLRQGKFGDLVRLIPASMRSDYNCRLDRAVSLLNLVIKKGKDLLDRPQV